MYRSGFEISPPVDKNLAFQGSNPHAMSVGVNSVTSLCHLLLKDSGIDSFSCRDSGTDSFSCIDNVTNSFSCRDRIIFLSGVVLGSAYFHKKWVQDNAQNCLGKTDNEEGN